MKKFTIIALLVITLFTLASCMEISASQKDSNKTIDIANRLQTNQPTPIDIDYSLERYNLTRRTYWVNGQREKANSYPCSVDKPLGYIVLFTDNGAVVGSFVVDGKVSSLNSYLTPNSEFYEQTHTGTSYGNSYNNEWLADVDGSYGENDTGIFFFTPDGKYLEWTGTYLYSDIPFEISDPLIRVVNE